MLTTILGGRDPPGRPIPKYIKAQPERQSPLLSFRDKKGWKRAAAKIK
jgi:hypothetical protein